MNARPSAVASPAPRSRRSASRALLSLAWLGVVALSGCATTSPAYHRYVMQGQVLSVEDSTLTVCVGARDGAQIGQVLEVVRHVSRPSSLKSPQYRREEIGTVRIVRLFDEHYATAQVLEGHPMINDMVELERR